MTFNLRWDSILINPSSAENTMSRKCISFTSPAKPHPPFRVLRTVPLGYSWAKSSNPEPTYTQVWTISCNVLKTALKMNRMVVRVQKPGLCVDGSPSRSQAAWVLCSLPGIMREACPAQRQPSEEIQIQNLMAGFY